MANESETVSVDSRSTTLAGTGNDALTEGLLEVLSVDDGGAGLSTAKDTFLETRVEGRVGARVVGYMKNEQTRQRPGGL